jgi:hypothetical protein
VKTSCPIFIMQHLDLPMQHDHSEIGRQLLLSPWVQSYRRALCKSPDQALARIENAGAVVGRYRDE